MRIATVLGTRPEIIRLSRVIGLLDEQCEHRVIHTGQNYDFNLKDVFFQQLNVRPPDHFLNAHGSLGQQVAVIFQEAEKLFRRDRPDRLLLLGDTNSGLVAVLAKRMGIPVYHMEAGNRCYDDRVPEEINRRVIDHSSDILMPYTERSRQNLLREGIPGQRVFVVGNPIREVIQFYEKDIRRSDVLARLSLRPKEYFLATMHRAENVDEPDRLRSLVTAFGRIHTEYGKPVLVSTHPRTKARLDGQNFTADRGVIFAEPFGFFDFIALERNARCVLTDSGTVQEECCIYNVPNVTIRDVTERPETVEYGHNILSGAGTDYVMAAVRKALSRPAQLPPPPEYLFESVSNTVLNIVLGYAR